MIVGIVKWFDSDKGFGMIVGTDGEEYFLHQKGLEQRNLVPYKGMLLLFHGLSHTRGLRAEKTRIPYNMEDFVFCLTPLLEDNLSDEIRIRIKEGQYRITTTYKISNKIISYLITRGSLANFLTDFLTLKKTAGWATEKFVPLLWAVTSCEDIKKISETEEDEIFGLWQDFFGEEYYFNLWNEHQGNANNQLIIDIDWVVKYKHKLSDRSLAIIFKLSDYEELQLNIIDNAIAEANQSDAVKQYKKILRFLPKEYLVVSENIRSKMLIYTVTIFDNQIAATRSPEDLKICRDLINLVKEKGLSTSQEIETKMFAYSTAILEHELPQYLRQIKEYGFLRNFRGAIEKRGEILKNFYLNVEQKQHYYQVFSDLFFEDISELEHIELYLSRHIPSIDFEIIVANFDKFDAERQRVILRFLVEETDLHLRFFEQTLKKDNMDASFELMQFIFKLRQFDSVESSKKMFFVKSPENQEAASFRETFLNFYDKDAKSKFQLFLLGFSKTLPLDYVLEHPLGFNKEDLERFFQHLSDDKDTIQKILIRYIEQAGAAIENEKLLSRRQIIKLSEKFLDEAVQQQIIDELFKNVLEHPVDFNKEDLERFFQHLSDDKAAIQKILIRYIEQAGTATGDEKLLNKEEIIRLSEEFVEAAAQKQIIDELFKNVSDDEYLAAWYEGVIKVFPYQQIWRKDVEKSFYAKLVKQVKANISCRDEFVKLLKEKIATQKDIEIDDKPTFDQVYCVVETLRNVNRVDSFKYTSADYPWQQMVLWEMDLTDDFDFERLKRKFIFFEPESQVTIIKKLFKLKEQGTFSLTTERLMEIVRTSYDLYQLNEKWNKQDSLDLTTDLIITALHSYKTAGKFLVEKQLFEILVRSLENGHREKFQIKSYFETCKGRTTAKINLHNTNGTISKVPFRNNQFYYKFEFPYNATIVEKIRKIPGRKWNKEERFWGVPANSKEAVQNFAKENRFRFEFEGNKYENNAHLAVENLEKVPKGITFCEGRKAKKLDSQRKVPFYWCCNKSCYKLSETTHQQSDWKDYNFLDFCRILELDVDEHSPPPYGFIPKGNYYKFMGLINRFNRLLEKLYCFDCNHILYPKYSSHFAHHRAVRFHCQNENCSSKEEVYLHHCLNGRCKSIIDSRISKKCEHGLFICESCLSCCSHDMLSRRLANLKKIGGYIHPQLETLVKEQAGHLERKEHFCYKCGGKMQSEGTSTYNCPTCLYEKDLSEFRKRGSY
jgi:cold shock CspA family protein